MDHEGLLTDTEREWFTQIGFELAPTSKMRLMDENYLIYKAFVTASHFLYVSYPMADNEGKALLPSMYIKKLHQMVSDLPVEVAVVDPSDMLTDELDLNFHQSSTPYIALCGYAASRSTRNRGII